jgi:hypothetical protein
MQLTTFLPDDWMLKQKERKTKDGNSQLFQK